MSLGLRSLFICGSLSWLALPAAGLPAPSVGCGNELVRLDFNATKGSFTITDQRDHRACVVDAAFAVNEWTSDPSYAYRSSVAPFSDATGPGSRLLVEGVKAGQPSLLLEGIVYAGKSWVALSAGVRNTTAQTVRVMRFQPLRGVAYRGQRLDDCRMLDGESGAEVTHVTDAVSLTSKNNLLVTFGRPRERKRSLVLGGLVYAEFTKSVSAVRSADGLTIELNASDPSGKRVDAGATYISPDRFYVDCGTDNRFEALEKYGAALAVANHADITGVTFPVLNFWYSFIAKFGGDEFRDNSIGTIEEMQHIADSGFLKYSSVALRLEPDDYSLPNNQQGWWDDKHWQRYKGGQLLPPYETIVKWGAKVRAMGGIPFIYCQTAKRSEDYCVEHPDQMLFNSATAVRSKGPVGWWGRSGDKTAIYWTYDFTDPGFIAHMKDVYRNLRAGGVQGIKFDYPDTGWAYDGGFEDKYATTTSAYRNIFRLAYEGLGPGRDVQERIPPFGDVALGVITTQRSEGDNDRVYPTRVAKTGLRWYKDRVVTNYDCDPINPAHVYPTGSRDGWRAAVTMTTTTSGRLEIGKYFEKMSPDQLHDLSRAVPLLPAPAHSARPIDAFTGVKYPQVYDFSINPAWHIVTFFNSRIQGEEWPTDVMAYWAEGKQFIPRQMLPAPVAVPLGEATDDGGLGLDPKKQYHVFDFWNWTYVGKFPGNATLRQNLRPGEARVMAVHEAADHPQFLSTNRHLLQGYLDFVSLPIWDATAAALSGTSRLVAGETCRIIVATNGRKIKGCAAEGAASETALFDAANSLYELRLLSPTAASTPWEVTFDR